MGIEVDATGLVSLTDDHERRVVTSVGSNPTLETVRDLEISSIFKRTKAGDEKGDGNSLIYALKNIKGFRISPEERVRIFARADEIIRKIVKDQFYDFIVPIPSSSTLCKEICETVANRCANRVPILDCLKKATIGEALIGMPNADDVDERHRREYTSLLRTLQKSSLGASLQMKLVPGKIRHYVTPMAKLTSVSRCEGASVLLVDDLCASGTSLAGAASLIRSAGARKVRALCLLSRIG